MGSAHAEHELAFGGGVPLLERTSFAAPRQGELPQGFERVVFGYLPYWSDAADVPWSHLSHLAYFSVGVNSDGSLGDDRGWTAGGAALTATAHGHGVKVVLVATLFGTPSVGTLLASAGARAALIDNLLARVSAQDGDGVNIDFEYVPQAQKAAFVQFMTDLTTAFHASIPGSHVSLASPAVDWSDAYDYEQLAVHTDGMMIMGYDYYWSGSNPGPVSPIASGTLWGTRNLRWTVNDYLTYGGEENRAKMILGFPLYGRDWPTTNTTLPGTRTANGSSVLYEACQTRFAAGKSWDSASQTPYRTYMDGTQAHQMFCEDTASLEAKLDLVLEFDLGGAMFWALGYVPPGDPLWEATDARFTAATPNQPPAAHAGAPATALPGEIIELDGSASADADGDVLTYRWTALEGPPVSIDGFAGARAVVRLDEVGRYRFRLTVSDGELEDSAEAEVVVAAQMDDAGPAGGDADEATAPMPPPRGCEEGCSAASAPVWVGWLLLVRAAGRRRDDFS